MCSKDCPTIGEMWASNNLRTMTLASHWSVKASHWKCIIVHVEKYLQTSFDPSWFLLFSIFLIFLCLEHYFYPWNILITHLEHAPFSSSITSHLFFRVHNNVSIPTLWKMFTTIVPHVIRENVSFPLLGLIWKLQSLRDPILFPGWVIHGDIILVTILVFSGRFFIPGFCSPFLPKEPL